MIQVVQANCPKCRSVLRIPADWIGRPMRCKLCREMFQARARVEILAIAPSVPTPLPPTPVSGARMPNQGSGNSFSFREELDLKPTKPPRSLPYAPQTTNGPGLGLGITGMVLGILGFVLTFIPFFGWLMGVLLGVLGVIFSGIGLGLTSKSGSGKGISISGLVLSI